jgi:hypothetical protein
MRLAAKRALDMIGDKRPPAVPVEKADKRKRRTKGGAKKGQSKSAVAQALDKSMVNELVSPEARAKGDYRPVDFKLTEVVEGGKVKAKTAKVVRNLARTQIDRWCSRGRLDDRQVSAIMFYQEAFRQVFGDGPRVTANYAPGIGRDAAGAIELWASSVLRAKEALRLLDQEVFFREPVDHFQVWQNVVIWDEPSGVAGGRIGFCHKPAEAVALVIVGNMAHKIADIVIDRSWAEFGHLLLDIDAPRRPGKRAA